MSTVRDELDGRIMFSTHDALPMAPKPVPPPLLSLARSRSLSQQTLVDMFADQGVPAG